MDEKELKEIRGEFEKEYSKYREETNRKLSDSNTKLILVIVIAALVLFFEFGIIPLF